MKKTVEMTSEQLLAAIADVLKTKKTRDAVAVKVDHLTVVADYFVICSVSSTTGVRALAETLDEKLSEQGVEPLRMEGLREGRWAAIDFGSIIVHVFHEETRQIYQLEKLWSDGTNVIALGQTEEV